MLLILIPCKNLDAGKSRLAGCLDRAARRLLCEAFLRRTLSVATSAVDPRQVMVITADSRAVEIAGEYGASGLVERATELNAALAEARIELISNRLEQFDTLVLPIDLPLATASSLLKAATTEANVAIAPDDEGTGTNLLFIGFAAFHTFPFSFGLDSYRNHCMAARRAGLTLHTIKDRRLAFDVDRPEQFFRWQQMETERSGLLADRFRDTKLVLRNGQLESG